MQGQQDSDIDGIPDLFPQGRGAYMHTKTKGGRTEGVVPVAPIEQVERPAVSVSDNFDRPTALSAEMSNIARELDHSSTLKKHATATLPSTSDVVIHVYDETRNTKRDFYCKRALLLSQMTYFSKYLYERATVDNVEIDVHCDIEVFEWLMSYISRKKPAFEPRTAISILISSSFLQMAALEDLCLKFVHDHMNNVLKVPIDLACITGPLLKKLAGLFTVDELSSIQDPRDKLLSQLYFSKISDMLIPGKGNVLRKCQQCGNVYALKEEGRLRCHKMQLSVDRGGELKAFHQHDASFDINSFVAGLYLEGLSWKDMYWRIWGILNHLECSTCHETFACADYASCFRHTQQVSFPPGEAIKGYYSCCGAEEHRFNPFKFPSGCRQFTHTPTTAGSSAEATFRTHMKDIVRSRLTVAEKKSAAAIADEAKTKNNCGPSASRLDTTVFGTWIPPSNRGARDLQQPMMKHSLEEPETGSTPTGHDRDGTASTFATRTWSGPILARRPQHIQRGEDTARLQALAKKSVARRCTVASLPGVC
ncbi:hypothetical protein DFS34DRAFT_612197 [Phlyctochytrium arcticum]|nr:hypothetical protein DFS34DRAFT_612197 [Phlyctochytrium arcticum]